MSPLAKLLEAALFASARPVPTEELAVLDPEATPAALQAALDELREHYDNDGHGVELAAHGNLAGEQLPQPTMVSVGGPCPMSRRRHSFPRTFLYGGRKQEGQ